MEGSLRRVLRSEELTAGGPTRPATRRVRAGAGEVLLARLEGGEVVAFDTNCPHQGTSLEDATVWEGRLRCPRHLYLYDPHTGENVLPARDAPPGTLWKLRPGYLPVYRVEERDGWIWVADSPEPPPPGYDSEAERRPGRPEEPETAATGPGAGEAGPVEHPTATVATAVGEELEVSLEAAPRPGHLWRGELPEQLLVVSQGYDRVRLLARAPGEVTMRWLYARPWDVEPAEVRTFVVRIDPRGT